MAKSNDTEMLIRFGVSMEKELLKSFDQLISHKGYNNRSEAIRDLARAELVRQTWEKTDDTQVAVLGIVYEHEHSGLLHRLTHLQHEHQHLITTSLHIHLNDENCMEVLILQGKGKALKKFADNILSIKGVKFGQIMHGSTGRNI